MANKEYQMLFKLGAQLGSNFNGTFSSAQKVLQTTQKEIQALNKTQSDIGAYQRQQQSIEKTNEKLELYKKQLDNVQKEMSESGEYSSTLANRELELQQRIRNTEEQIASKNQKLTEMSGRLTEAGVNVSELTTESARLEAEIRDLQEEEEKAAAEAARFGDEGASAFEAVGSALVAAGIASALNKIADEYKACVEASMEFGYTMSTVEALSGASVTEMQTLTATAKELGATTAFTANQSAQAMTYMGMAGWNAKQMISGMDGVLNLAAASGEDLALVSDIVTDNLTAFGLKASDTAHFADVLAAAATNSNTSVELMGETFKTSASIAGTLGYSVEDVAIQIGLMANSGVKASIGGTALRNIFNGISGEVTLTSKAFGEATYTGVNLDGSMKDLSEVVSDLRVYFDQMTDSEKKANAQAIAGERGYGGLLAMLNATEEEYQRVSDSIYNCTGAAQKMANIKLDNLQGDVTLLDSATDGLRMTIGGLYEDELRQAAQVGTEIITKINEFCEQNPAVVKAIMAAAAAIGSVVAVYYALNAAKKIKGTIDAINTALTIKNTAATIAETAAITAQTAAQTGLNAAQSASPIGLIILGVGALAGGISLLCSAMSEAADETDGMTASTREQYYELQDLNEEYEEARKLYGENDERTLRLRYRVDELTESYEANKLMLEDLKEETQNIAIATEEMKNVYSEDMEEIAEKAYSAAALVQKLKDLAAEEYSEEAILAITEKLGDQYSGLSTVYDGTAESIFAYADAIEEAIKQERNALEEKKRGEIYTEAIVNVKPAEDQLETAQKEIEAAFRGMDYFSIVGIDPDKWFEEQRKLGRDVFSADGLEQWLNSIGSIDNEFILNSNDVDELWEYWSVLKASEITVEDLNNIIRETEESWDEAANEAVSAYDAMSIAVSDVTARTEDLLKAYNDAYQAAYDSISGQYALWDEAAEISAISTDTINSNLQGQADYWSSYNTNLETLLGKTGQIDGLKDVIATFADGSADSVNAIAGMASASDEDLTKMVENWKKVKEEQDKTAKALADTRVDFKSELDEIAEDMKETVDAMNLDEDAKKAAEATIKAYADAIKAGQGSVTEAANIVAAAVSNSLNIASNFNGGTTGKTNAYASGTDYADSGYAIVGENGPELVRMAGGERVYNAADTRAILGGRNTENHFTIAPQISINGASGIGEEQIREISDQIIEMVRNGLEDADIDRRRSVYA